MGGGFYTKGMDIFRNFVRYDKAGVDKNDFNEGIDLAGIAAIANTPDVAAASNALDSVRCNHIAFTAAVVLYCRSGWSLKISVNKNPS